MIPPSPAISPLVGDRLNTSASPNPPTIRSPRRDPKAWAASKNSRMPLSRASRPRASVSQGGRWGGRGEVGGGRVGGGPAPGRGAPGGRVEQQVVGADVGEGRSQAVPDD